MASETVSSDHSTVPEKLEKEVHEEAKTMEENVPQSKVSQEKAKEEEVQSRTTPLAEAEEKIKEKESQPPKVEEVGKAEVEEKPKAEESTIAITSVEPQEKIEEKQTEAPVAEENKKPDDVLVLNNAELTKDSVPEVIKSESKGQPQVKDVEKPQEESTKESVEEQSREIEIPESTIQVVEKKEDLPEKNEILESVAETVEAKEGQPAEFLEKVEIPESTTETVDVKELLNKTEIPESVIAESKEVQPKELPATELEIEGVKDVEIPTAEDKKEKAPESATETVDVKELLNKTEIPESVIAESKEVQPEELPPKEPETEGFKDVEVPAAEDKKEKAPESSTETVDVKELLNKTEIPESVIAESKEVQPEELPPKEPETEGVKDVEVPAAEDKKEKAPESSTETVDVKELLNKTEIPESVIAESKEVQPEYLPPKEPEIEGVKDVEVPAPVSAPEVKDKPEEKPEIPAQIEDKSSAAEPAEKLEAESTKDKGIQANSTPEEVHIVGKDVEVPAPVESAEKTVAEEPVKVEEKIEKENEGAKDEKIEEKEEKTAIVEDSTQPEVKGVEDTPVTISQEAGKIIEQTSREIELPAENGSKKDETIMSNETPKDVEIEKKVDVEEPQKAETETKEEKPVETKLEQGEKEVKESAITTTDAPIEEPTKETQELKTVTETPVKKQSNNLLAKMKQSLVKAKKAITGKSQSKSPPSETKDEVKAT